jgi:hypothetical protein
MTVFGVGAVGIQPLLDGAAGEMERLPPDGHLQRLKVQILQTLAAEQGFDLPQDLSGQQAVERGFF